jgi:transcriptional regulator
MYTPEHFAADDADALIARLSRRFAAILVTSGSDGLSATHVPILWDGERRIATGHIARNNPQWRGGDGPGLMILSGAEAYVSPGWYPSKAEHGKVVPTWNYEAVHLSGHVEWFDEPARLEALVRALSVLHEADKPAPWTLEDAPRAYIEAMLRGFVGVTLRADKIEAKRKLSQNKSAADVAGVAAGLLATGNVEDRQMATIMAGVKARQDRDSNA